MKTFIAVVACLAAGAAFAQAPAAPEAPVAVAVHKKAPPSLKHRKAVVKKERIKKAGN